MCLSKQRTMPLLLGASQQAWPCATTTPASPAHIATVDLALVKVVGVISMTTSYVLRLRPGAVIGPRAREPATCDHPAGSSRNISTATYGLPVHMLTRRGRNGVSMQCQEAATSRGNLFTGFSRASSSSSSESPPVNSSNRHTAWGSLQDEPHHRTMGISARVTSAGKALVL